LSPRATLSVPTIAAPRGHYSHAVIAQGRTLYVAGQVPIDADGEVVGADAATQARQVLSNLAAVLEAASATLADVVKTTVYLTNRDDRAAVGKVRQAYFTGSPPANTLVVVAGLADPRYLVEIEAIAVLPDLADT
jgi:2-iminobutanoate/2-iminopropanoate deaminase